MRHHCRIALLTLNKLLYYRKKNTAFAIPGLYPTDPVEAAFADAAVDAVVDNHQKLGPTLYEKDPIKKVRTRVSMRGRNVVSFHSYVLRCVDCLYTLFLVWQLRQHQLKSLSQRFVGVHSATVHAHADMTWRDTAHAARIKYLAPPL